MKGKQGLGGLPHPHAPEHCWTARGKGAVHKVCRAVRAGYRYLCCSPTYSVGRIEEAAWRSISGGRSVRMVNMCV